MISESGSFWLLCFRDVSIASRQKSTIPQICCLRDGDTKWDKLTMLYAGYIQVGCNHFSVMSCCSTGRSQ